MKTESGKNEIRLFAYRTGGDAEYMSLSVSTENELVEDMTSDISEELFEGSTIEEYLDYIVFPHAGGFAGEWMEIKIETQVKYIDSHTE